jgi:hypothetical protein
MNCREAKLEPRPLAFYPLSPPTARRGLAAATLVFAFVSVAFPGLAENVSGHLTGITRDSATGTPMAEVQIVVHSLDGGSDRATVTNTEGTFAFASVEPGSYEIAATKKGFRRISTNVELAASKSVTVELPLSAAAASATTAKNDRMPLTERELELLGRIDRLEARLAAVEGKGKVEQQTVAAAIPADQRPGDLPSSNPVAPPSTAAPDTAAPDPEQQIGGKAPTPKPAPPVAPPEHLLPEGLQAPDPAPKVDNDTPFAYADFGWLNGTTRSGPALDTKFFTPEIRFDTHFITDFNQPVDHTMGGSTEQFRSGEFQVEQISVGGDFHWQNVRGRVLYMSGLFASTTPRNDASSGPATSGPGNGVGQWDLRTAYRYVSEAYGGYHFDVNHGLNVDAGIFVSYIGLFSYYNFDNWMYQPSYVSSNTPWFFNGLRIQWFPTNKLKIEPWIINGWQSYARFNGRHGFGGQILWRPKEWLSMVFNNYGNGEDTLGVHRSRLHTDDSIEVRYLNRPENTGISKMAFSVTGDAGCEYGGGVTCRGGAGGPKQSFLGFMAYNRIWFHKDLVALTMGGGKMNNPGRYLTLLPPINGADAITGSPYFPQTPGSSAHMWDASIGVQYMPKKYITWWLETGYRHSNVPYWSGRGGITPPGGNNGVPTQFACITGAPSGTSDLNAAFAACGGPGTVWFPDLRRGQATVSAGVMVKF